ncbi:iron-containing alcohol dehydrogenase [Paraferrimonas sp. SM1919]|uniref:iron-containing alcohol dehydrogenase n=1 Tax=Paraferrimonas sp. SM1919 TaxID=2662263 RepID=UPI0013D0EFA5|nr:iron-containing alcohol dehydrogenase [Paraferrimonas sp. SM1919]
MKHQLLVNLKKPFLKYFPTPKPELIQGPGSLAQITSVLEAEHIYKPLIVTDKDLIRLGLVNQLSELLDSKHISYEIFAQITPDPSITLVEQGLEVFKKNNCDGIILFGGGSAMDCGKAIAACAATNKPVYKLEGLLKVLTKVPLMIAVPTTAGTGSEATVAAVISDKQTKRKFAIADPFILPKYAILDAELMLGLPPQITAHTGIDALTHGIESYLSDYASGFTRGMSTQAIKTVFTSLVKAFEDGQDLQARSAMAVASYQAGLAFTRTYVGYVHAIAHQLGALYGVPHGLANAVVLPKVLQFCVQAMTPRLAQLAEVIGVSGNSPEQKALGFISAVEQLLQQLAIPTCIEQLQIKDITEIAQRANAEVHGTYPVPQLLTQAECEQLISQLLPA